MTNNRPGPRPGNPYGHRTRCRCSDACKAYANADVRASRGRGPRGTARHGTIGTYGSGCRCPECREARRVYSERRRRSLGVPPRKLTGNWTTPREPRDVEPVAAPALTVVDGLDQREPCGPWVADAACRGVDPDLFFPERGGDVATAKAICAACPVTAECLAHALDNREVFGIWGGKSERERRRLRRAMRLSVAS